jgi:large subunit ribosomal protein L3
VTVLSVAENVVITKGENKTTIGFGKKKDSRTHKPQLEMLKKNGVKYGVRTIREMTGTIEKNAGDMIVPSDVFSVGDSVKVAGTSKGLGFAGVVKRHHFAGGPKTHGQSDRERAPGSIGNRTTPGRVFKNKRMAGRGGNKTVTVENLKVVAVNNNANEIWVKGVVPGAVNDIVKVIKTAEGKFEGLFSRADKKALEQKVEEAKEAIAAEAEAKAEAKAEEKAEEQAAEQKTEKAETKKEAKSEEKKEDMKAEK